MANRLLTKSKFLIGLQCPKCLWIMFHEPEKIPEVDEKTQHIFDQGHMVGELAKKWFPEGIDIDAEDFNENIKTTKELLLKRKPLFEAGILSYNIFSRADALNPVENDEWDIIEVKSSTQVKEVNLYDVAFQKHCYELSGLKIRKCFLMHINNEYVRQGNIDYKQLFVMEEITNEVNKIGPDMKERLDTLFKVIDSEVCPNISIHPNCVNPYECALHDDCWGSLPEGNVFELVRGGKKSFELYGQRIVRIKDIPDGFKLTANQQIQKDCLKNGKCHINKDEISAFLNQLKYPLHFLDFETFNTVIPLFDGVRPYQNIPFQFSLHIQDAKDDKLKHTSFLADGTEDPRPKFLEELKKAIQENGSIIVYNQSFEMSRLKELADAFPDYLKWIESILPRFADLIVPFRKFYYYDPKQNGSSSIKNVLPALTGNGYDEMEISNGEDASLKFLYSTFGATDETKPGEEEIKKVRENLEKYCGLDTEGMVWILKEIEKAIDQENTLNKFF